MADKLWSPLVDTDLVAIVDRQFAFANTLRTMGIPAGYITSQYCEINSAHCFGKY